jgi:branched-chain amino acid aminotransferase
MMWLNGKFVATQDAQLSVMDRATLLGEGIFETLRFHSGQIVLFNEHWARLCEAAAFFHLAVDYSADEIQSAMRELIRQGEFTAGSLRLTVTAGSGGRGLVAAQSAKANWIISCVGDTDTEAATDFIDLAIVSIMRAETNPSARFKTLSYIDNIAARNQAVECGAQDAILLNSRQQIACAAAGNIFLWIGNELLTPPVSDGAMPGIIRAEILKQKTIAQLTCREASLDKKHIADADGVIITNSLIGAKAAHKIRDGDVLHVKDVQHAKDAQHAKQEPGIKKGPPRIEAILEDIRKLAI